MAKDKTDVPSYVASGTIHWRCSTGGEHMAVDIEKWFEAANEIAGTDDVDRNTYKYFHDHWNEVKALAELAAITFQTCSDTCSCKEKQ